jgi:hypothetical protein
MPARGSLRFSAQNPHVRVPQAPELTLLHLGKLPTGTHKVRFQSDQLCSAGLTRCINLSTHHDCLTAKQPHLLARRLKLFVGQSGLYATGVQLCVGRS